MRVLYDRYHKQNNNDCIFLINVLKQGLNVLCNIVKVKMDEMFIFPGQYLRSLLIHITKSWEHPYDKIILFICNKSHINQGAVVIVW